MSCHCTWKYFVYLLYTFFIKCIFGYAYNLLLFLPNIPETLCSPTCVPTVRNKNMPFVKLLLGFFLLLCLIFVTWTLKHFRWVFSETIGEQIETPFCDRWLVSEQRSRLIGLNGTSPALCLKSHTNGLRCRTSSVSRKSILKTKDLSKHVRKKTPNLKPPTEQHYLKTWHTNMTRGWSTKSQWPGKEGNHSGEATWGQE